MQYKRCKKSISLKIYIFLKQKQYSIKEMIYLIYVISEPSLLLTNVYYNTKLI